MHKLTKGLKKKKKSKKGKKGEEEEFDPEELERYRRERAEAQQKAEEAGESADNGGKPSGNAGSDEWKKFEALTAGVDSILKKSQGDLDRIKSTSFFQRKAPFEEKKAKPDEDEASLSSSKRAVSSKKWVGFDQEGNPIEASESRESNGETKANWEQQNKLVNEDGFVDVPDDENEQVDSAEEDIFDTAYVDVLKNINVELAYIPDSPTEEEQGEDPFDTSNADRVLKTVDKKGKKLVTLGNAVEVLSGRIDHVSTCKLNRDKRPSRNRQDLLLNDFDQDLERDRDRDHDRDPDHDHDPGLESATPVERTLLDDDTDLLPNVPVDLTRLPPVLAQSASADQQRQQLKSKENNGDTPAKSPPLDISEFDVLKDKTILEEIPDLDLDLDDDYNYDNDENDHDHDDHEHKNEYEHNHQNHHNDRKSHEEKFGLSKSSGLPAAAAAAPLKGVEDPFASKEPEIVDPQTEIIEASFEAATFVNEEDPFDTTFAENILPGKVELKFIEKELESLPALNLPVSQVSISLTDPAGLNRDYETGLLTLENGSRTISQQLPKKDLLAGSTTDLQQLLEQPIPPEEQLTYVDPFDTSAVQDLPPGKIELKFLEKELLGEKEESNRDLDDDDFDPRRDDGPVPDILRNESVVIGHRQDHRAFQEDEKEDREDSSIDNNETEDTARNGNRRKPSRPEALEFVPRLPATKIVAFELPTPSKRPDLLATTEEEKASVPSKPLTPYYSQKPLDDALPVDGGEPTEETDPFDTSFVTKVAPGKTELKLIESELLNDQREIKLSHSLSDHDFNPRLEDTEPAARRQSDVTSLSLVSKSRSLRYKGEKFEEGIIDCEEDPSARETHQLQSLLDADIDIDAKPLTPKVETKEIKEEKRRKKKRKEEEKEEEQEEEAEDASYVDPFDTSIATNILPGKTELKLLENELEQITEKPLIPKHPISLITAVSANSTYKVDREFDLFAEQPKETKDFLCSDDQNPTEGAKVLTPIHDLTDLTGNVDIIDPFDTSFASIGPGKTELKLLESELMEK